MRHARTFARATVVVAAAVMGVAAAVAGCGIKLGAAREDAGARRDATPDDAGFDDDATPFGGDGGPDFDVNAWPAPCRPACDAGTYCQEYIYYALSVDGGGGARCEPLPDACAAAPTCACILDATAAECPLPPFCRGAGDTLTATCPIGGGR